MGLRHGDGDSGHAKAAATAAKAAAYVAQQTRAETGFVEASVISRPMCGGVKDGVRLAARQEGDLRRVSSCVRSSHRQVLRTL